MRRFYSSIAAPPPLLRLIPAAANISPDSWLSSHGKPLMPWPPPKPLSQSSPPPSNNPQPEVAETPSLQNNSATISHLLTNPFPTPSDLSAALDRTGINPSPQLLESALCNSELSPKPILALYRWASAKSGFTTTPSLLASVVDVLGKSRYFAAAWSLVINDAGDKHFDAFASIIRRYARAGMPRAAIRTYEIAKGGYLMCCLDNADDLFDVLIDTLCKEGRTGVAEECIAQRRAEEPGWVPSIRSYNMLLHGWFRARKLQKAERVWEEMWAAEGIHPTVVSYGILIEGLCRMRRVDRAIRLLEEMREEGIKPNAITCNPIVDALAEEKRFKEAMGMVEKFPLYGISPNIVTYNSLVKGFCKNGDPAAASKILKIMIGRGVVPMATTYNYFFRFFAKFGKIDDGMNLYTKMVQSGYAPDRLTYQLLIKMLCEEEKLDRAVQVIRDMNKNGFDSDLATSTMLVHMLCRMHRWEEACVEFEEMIRKGIVPQYLTYRRLVKDLKRLGMLEMARRLLDLMRPLLRSTKLPATYRGGVEEEAEKSLELRMSIVKKAKAMSDVLKASGERNELSELKSSTGIAVESANKFIADIKRRMDVV